MHKIEKIINYKFDNIEYLEKTMYVKKISTKKNNDEHANHSMATFGDSLLKSILA